MTQGFLKVLGYDAMCSTFGQCTLPRWISFCLPTLFVKSITKLIRTMMWFVHNNMSKPITGHCPRFTLPNQIYYCNFCSAVISTQKASLVTSSEIVVETRESLTRWVSQSKSSCSENLESRLQWASEWKEWAPMLWCLMLAVINSQYNQSPSTIKF